MILKAGIDGAAWLNNFLFKDDLVGVCQNIVAAIG